MSQDTQGGQGAPVTRVQSWANRIDRWPRMARVAVSIACTLVLTLLAWLVLSELFGLDPLDPEPDATAPLVIDVVLALVIYLLGWSALVGFDLDPDRPWRAGRVAVMFVVAGVSALFVLVMLMLFGLAFGYVL